MKIVIAAWHLKDFNVGLGRYCRSLIEAMARVDGEHQYEIRTNGSSPARVRAWHCGETALRESGARIAGGLDERDFDPWGDRLIAVVPGWS